MGIPASEVPQRLWRSQAARSSAAVANGSLRYLVGQLLLHGWRLAWPQLLFYLTLLYKMFSVQWEGAGLGAPHLVLLHPPLVPLGMLQLWSMTHRRK